MSVGLDGQEDEFDPSEQMVEEHISQEELEYGAIMSSMEAEASNDADPKVPIEPGGYGSEEEDYDAIMMEVMLHMGDQQRFQNPDNEQNDGEMDMSIG